MTSWPRQTLMGIIFPMLARLVIKALQATIKQKTVTGDLACQLKNATKVGTAEFGEAIVANM